MGSVSLKHCDQDTINIFKFLSTVSFFSILFILSGLKILHYYFSAGLQRKLYVTLCLILKWMPR